jgi:hypothetical protein
MLRLNLMSAPLISFPQPRQSLRWVVLRQTRKRSSRCKSINFSSGEIAVLSMNLPSIRIAENRIILFPANRAAPRLQAPRIPEGRPHSCFAAK